jgi:N-acetylglucosamine-6-phosphate deacetylase
VKKRTSPPFCGPKGLDRAVLVSDVTALGGLPPGLYAIPSAGGTDARRAARGRRTLFLAGAARPLKQDVALAIEMAGVPLACALRLATVNPGRFVGGRGRLVPSASADLIRFHWTPGDRDLVI